MDRASVRYGTTSSDIVCVCFAERKTGREKIFEKNNGYIFFQFNKNYKPRNPSSSMNTKHKKHEKIYIYQSTT